MVKENPEINMNTKVISYKMPKFVSMAAPEGNQFWKLRSKHGRDKLFETPELLWEAATEYFEWCHKSPINANQNLGTKNVNAVSFTRPFTKDGLCIFLDIDDQTFNNYRDAENKDFLEVCRKIERVIRSQKFDGAAIGIFNANIIARDLGLSDKVDSRFVDKNDNDIQPKLIFQPAPNCNELSAPDKK